MTWTETYRGTVHRWEVDNVDHFTVAYYFERFEDATAMLLDAIGVDAPGAITECRVRYAKELRMGDLLNVRSAVTGVDGDALLLGHELIESTSGTVCTTLEQRTVALTSTQRRKAEALRGDWATPPEPARTAPTDGVTGREVGFVDAARDTVKPWEVDRRGHADWPAHIHRFSASNGHAIANLGMTPAYMRDQRRGFSTFEFRLRFLGLLRTGDLVAVRTGLLHVGGSSIRLFHRMTNAGSGALIATLEQSGVHLDLDARRPAPLPDDFRERAGRMLIRPASGA